MYELQRGGRVVRWRYVWLLLTLLLCAEGCKRAHYVRRADRDTYSILREKSQGKPWEPPPDFDVRPHPLSRFFDPTDPVDPLLPMPAPQLYAYELPELPERDPRRFRGNAGGNRTAPEELPPPGAEPYGAQPSPASGAFDEVQPVTYQLEPAAEQPLERPGAERGEFGSAEPLGGAPLGERPLDDRPPTLEDDVEDRTGPAARAEGGAGITLRVPPLSASAWEALPENCLQRMFEFDSVRQEYERTFERQPGADRRIDAERVSLEDVVDLALINNRDYQTQKELLYLTALRLTLVRYDYMLRFSPTGNGTSALYTHTNVDGVSESDLAINSGATLEKTLATGGRLVADFANNVVLTFNGPQGFTADVSSEMLVGLTQSVFQRDIVFESLTQAERDVVYAARDFARFRRVLFRNLANQYYNLLLTYRRIEIDSQDYFSTFRAFHQGEAEYRAGRLPRFQVDQLEQNALSSRNRLIEDCTALENALDQLKLLIGLPPELPLNVDLVELEELTLRDQAAVSAERVRRARRSLEQELQVANPDRGVLLNGALDLTQRLLDLGAMRSELGRSDMNRDELEQLLLVLSIEEARLLASYNREALEQARNETPPTPLRVFQRSLELVDSLAVLAERELRRIRIEVPPNVDMESLQRQLDALRASYDQLRAELDAAVADREIERVTTLVDTAQALLTDAENFIRQLDQIAGRPPLDNARRLEETISQVQWLLERSEEALSSDGSSLPPIEIDMDEALLTALVLRLDLMNQRGELADDWRQIKLAGDELRSVLNLSATQRLSSRSLHDSPNDFTIDTTQTQVGIQFDAPLNRRAQRNAFRSSLINYNASLRSLMLLEDTIKLDVRNDLRQLTLNQEQYRIAVASAALAYERVISTRLQLQLGVQNVAARDFLEAQQAYTASLSSVAGVQIRYLLNRIELFLDLEQLYVGPDGFWSELYNRDQQPEVVTQLPQYALPAYGHLPHGVWYSKKVRRMLDVPTGTSSLGRDESP